MSPGLRPAKVRLWHAQICEPYFNERQSVILLVLAASNSISFERLCRSAIDHHRQLTGTGQCAIGTGVNLGAAGTAVGVSRSRVQGKDGINRSLT